MNFLSNPYVKAALTVGALMVAAKYVPNQQAKAMLLGAAGVVALKQVPFVNSALA